MAYEVELLVVLDLAYFPQITSMFVTIKTYTLSSSSQFTEKI